MQITILNGGMRDDIADNLERLVFALKEQGFKTKNFNLKEMAINNCIGCFSCWVRNPGICIHNDDMKSILVEYMRSDLVLLISEVSAGFVTSLLRKATERLLPLFHAYLTIRNQGFCHLLRYAKYPYSILLLKDVQGLSCDQVALIDNIYANMNLNHKFTKVIKDDMGEIINEIKHLCGIS